eukprot:2553576-Rhodomonas_salina.2
MVGADETECVCACLCLRLSVRALLSLSSLSLSLSLSSRHSPSLSSSLLLSPPPLAFPTLRPQCLSLFGLAAYVMPVYAASGFLGDVRYWGPTEICTDTDLAYAAPRPIAFPY